MRGWACCGEGGGRGGGTDGGWPAPGCQLCWAAVLGGTLCSSAQAAARAWSGSACRPSQAPAPATHLGRGALRSGLPEDHSCLDEPWTLGGRAGGRARVARPWRPHPALTWCAGAGRRHAPHTHTHSACVLSPKVDLWHSLGGAAWPSGAWLGLSASAFPRRWAAGHLCWPGPHPCSPWTGYESAGGQWRELG